MRRTAARLAAIPAENYHPRRVRKLAFLIGVLLCAGLAAGVAGASTRKIFVANKACTGHTYKPRTIVIACGDGSFYASHLRYRSYGGSTARARGKLVANDCKPSCVAGKFHAYPGRIKLSHVATCNGRRYYERISWTFTGRHDGQRRTGSASIKPDTCAGPSPPPPVGSGDAGSA